MTLRNWRNKQGKQKRNRKRKDIFLLLMEKKILLLHIYIFKQTILTVTIYTNIKILSMSKISDKKGTTKFTNSLYK
ncbi:hypothetical protein LguiA_030254 [Lonicera macranthoides]